MTPIALRSLVAAQVFAALIPEPAERSEANLHRAVDLAVEIAQMILENAVTVTHTPRAMTLVQTEQSS